MRVVDKILRVAAVIASEEAKICLSKSSFIKVFLGFSMVKIHFLQKVLKKWSSFRKRLLYFFPLLGGSRPKSGIFDFVFFYFF